MLRKIAVVLRGAPRTWKYTKSSILNFYDSLATHVDYYWVSFYHPDIDDVKEDFQGRSLIAVLGIPIVQQYYNTFNVSEYQRKSIINIINRQELSTGQYDYIFESRPDQLVWSGNIDVFLQDSLPGNMQLSVTELGVAAQRLMCKDCFYIADSITYKKFCDIPYADVPWLSKTRWSLCPEELVFEQCFLHDISFKLIKTDFGTGTVRPNIVDFIGNNNVTAEHWKDIGQSYELWRTMNSEEKENYFKQYNSQYRW
jgi:hypothetical protein